MLSSDSDGTPFLKESSHGLRSRLVNLLTSGLPQSTDAEPLHRVKITNGLAALATLFFLVFSIHHFQQIAEKTPLMPAPPMITANIRSSVKDESASSLA